MSMTSLSKSLDALHHPCLIIDSIYRSFYKYTVRVFFFFVYGTEAAWINGQPVSYMSHFVSWMQDCICTKLSVMSLLF